MFFEALERGDVEAMMTVYTDDPITLPPDGSIVRGRAALRELWVGYLARASKVEVEHERAALEVEGDSA